MLINKRARDIYPTLTELKFILAGIRERSVATEACLGAKSQSEPMLSLPVVLERL